MSVAPWVVSSPRRLDAEVTFRPILDLARGVAAGYQTVGSAEGIGGRPPVGPDAGTVMAAALAAGGRVVDDSNAPEWWTLADPEGNEVDLAPWRDDSEWSA